MVTLLIAATVIAFLLGVFPIVHHFVVGLRERKREIMCLLDDTAISRYFDQFYHATAEQLNREPRKELSKIYNERFGVRVFIFPVILYVASLTIALVAIAVAVNARLSNQTSGFSIDAVWAHALAGAYLWSTYYLISRFRQRNLIPSALYIAALRILMAIPFAVTIGWALKEGAAAPVAFFLGAFPTNTLFLIARRNVGHALHLGNQIGTDAPTELGKLQGVSQPVAEALSDVGVTTLVQLAYEDPIQLAMRTNLSFYFILDLVGQSLLGIYVDLTIARRYSLRGSVETSSLAEKYTANDRNAIQVVTELARALRISKSVLVEHLSLVSQR
jgi:hypothetical protein